MGGLAGGWLLLLLKDVDGGATGGASAPGGAGRSRAVPVPRASSCPAVAFQYTPGKVPKDKKTNKKTNKQTTRTFSTTRNSRSSSSSSSATPRPVRHGRRHAVKKPDCLILFNEFLAQVFLASLLHGKSRDWNLCGHRCYCRETRFFFKKKGKTR